MGIRTSTKEAQANQRGLDECPFPRVLSEIAAQEATGTLSLKSGNLQKQVRFREGVPCQVDSNIASESLERFMVERGELAESVAQRALAAAATENRHVGEVLVQMRAVQPNELFVALKRSLGRSILSVFGWKRGSSSFLPGELALDQMLTIKVKSAPLILRGVCNFTPIQLIQQDFGDKLDHVHRIRKERMHDIHQLHTNSKESRIVKAIGKGRTLMQLSQEVDEEQELILRILYALSLLNLTESTAQHSKREARIQVDDARPASAIKATPPLGVPTVSFAASRPSPKAQATPAPAPKPAASTPPAPEPKTPLPTLSAKERNALDAAYLDAKSRDFYQLFDIPKNFTFGQLKKSFLDRCNRFSPMSLREYSLGDQEDRAEELFLAMVHAFSLLALPSTRATYVEEYERRNSPSISAQESMPTKPKNAFAVKIPHDVSNSVNSGLELINDGELDVALSCLTGAYESTPDDAYTCAFLGYALHMVDPLSRAKQALQLLERATELNATLSYPFLLLGRVAEFHEDRQRALRAYEDCMAIDPTENEAEEAIARLSRLRG